MYRIIIHGQPARGDSCNYIQIQDDTETQKMKIWMFLGKLSEFILLQDVLLSDPLTLPVPWADLIKEENLQEEGSYRSLSYLRAQQPPGWLCGRHMLVLVIHAQWSWSRFQQKRSKFVKERSMKCPRGPELFPGQNLPDSVGHINTPFTSTGLLVFQSAASLSSRSSLRHPTVVLIDRCSRVSGKQGFLAVDSLWLSQIILLDSLTVCGFIDCVLSARV